LFVPRLLLRFATARIWPSLTCPDKSGEAGMKQLAMTMAAALALGGCVSNTTTVQQAPPAAKTNAAMVTVEKKAPTDFRRVTFIVRDIEASLKLYRDVLGFSLNYDQTLEMSGVALPAGTPGAKARLVLLNANDPYIGWVGMLQWLDPPLADPGPYPKRLGVGGHVLVMNTDDAKARCDQAAALPGVTMTSPARLQIYPGRNGGPDIQVMGCNIFDMDGTFIELNQVLK
jgi:catechol 2,3-dioxygenase-like lactoylglutathione lyase family enzyme